MGKVTVVGGKVGMEAPKPSILASTLAVGSTVYLLENGSPVEYLVVHQGRPSTMYDSSCDGTWLLRKALPGTTYHVWASTGVDDYSKSIAHDMLKNTWINNFDESTKNAIKDVKIPYCNGHYNYTVYSGANGLSTKFFLLSGYEVGFTTSNNNYLPVDGAKLSYFTSGTSSTAKTKRVAYNANSVKDTWQLRSTYKLFDDENGYGYHFGIGSDGSLATSQGTHLSTGIRRPACIIPSDARFDKDTLILMGVS